MAELEKLLRLPAKHTQVAAVEVHLEMGESLLELAVLVAAHPADCGRRSPALPDRSL
jgi:hypothetical protein